LPAVTIALCTAGERRHFGDFRLFIAIQPLASRGGDPFMSTPIVENGKTGVDEVAAAAVAVPDTHPPAIWFFFWGEFAERCSYYGMRAILPLYLTSTLHFAATRAGAVMYTFKMACYFLPLLGGFLADRFFGKYWTIVGFSVPYVLGHFILGIPNDVALVIALALLAGGSGVIKPNISTLMGQTYDQKRPGKEQLRSAAFQIFYLSINVGAFLSQSTLPTVRDNWGYRMAFQFPAWLMVASLIVFALGKPYYGVDTFKRHELSDEEKEEQWKTLVRLAGVFSLIIFFWVTYEQNDTLWVFFTRDYVDRNVSIAGHNFGQVAPDQIQALNPLFVIILIPTFIWLFKRIDPNNRVFTAMTKILLGFLCTAAAAGTMSLAGFLTEVPAGATEIDSAARVSVYWVAASYIILTVGEVLLYGTALELAYAAAPKTMKGFVTACFLVTNTLGNFINSWLAQLYGGSLEDAPEQRGPLSAGQFFLMSALIAFTAGIAFYFVGRNFNRGQQPQSVPAEA
jgi:POT family proton-dependent oligopeptide transporter